MGYTTDQKFSAVFGVTSFSIKNEGKQTINDPTLLQALGADGSNLNVMARHAVAALLNATNPDISYGMDEAEVIAAVQAVLPGEDPAALAAELVKLNEAGCPISQ